MQEKDWAYIIVRPGEKVKVDSEDLERISQHKWRITYGSSGRPRVVTSVRKPEGVRNITLGKFLMDPPKGKQVYPRRYQDGLDYRKDNLIVCTVAERQRLLPKQRKDCSSEYRGVSFEKKKNKWRASIEFDGKSINLGLFPTEDQAALAYNKAALDFFGELAYQNRVGVDSEKRTSNG